MLSPSLVFWFARPLLGTLHHCACARQPQPLHHGQFHKRSHHLGRFGLQRYAVGAQRIEPYHLNQGWPATSLCLAEPRTIFRRRTLEMAAPHFVLHHRRSTLSEFCVPLPHSDVGKCRSSGLYSTRTRCTNRRSRRGQRSSHLGRAVCGARRYRQSMAHGTIFPDSAASPTIDGQ